jgi:glycosyltransferase involved in cell wall biosynthesis
VKVLFFGTFDRDLHPRIRVLMEGFADLGAEVAECNAPLGFSTAWRVRLLGRPWLVPVLLVRLASRWWRLWRKSRDLQPVDAVIVGYLGHFDVHLARRLWRDRPIVLDYLVSGRDTAADRRVAPGLRWRLLDRVDRAALAAADVVIVDTREHWSALPDGARDRAVATPVGAPRAWFRPPTRSSGPARAVFFGLFTPLQGAPTIGMAMAILARSHPDLGFTMIGHGQDLEEARVRAGPEANVEWVPWVEPEELPSVVASHDICLGIFGGGPKALRVVPNKVFQGAAAGCAVVTSDTAPQRAALGDVGIHVPPEEPEALARALGALAGDPERLWALRQATWEHARREFMPASSTAPLHTRLTAVLSGRVAPEGSVP